MTNKQVIDALRHAGLHVQVRHVRRAYVGWIGGTVRELVEQGAKLADIPFEPHPKGGHTQVAIRDATVDESRRGDPMGYPLLAHGRATCSTLDNFNRKIGLSIALGRAVKQLVERDDFADLAITLDQRRYFTRRARPVAEMERQDVAEAMERGVHS